jgi:hypothetical protein
MQHTGIADFGPLVSWLLSATPPPKAGIQLRDVYFGRGFNCAWSDHAQHGELRVRVSGVTRTSGSSTGEHCANGSEQQRLFAARRWIESDRIE